jgi:two-component system response regulator DevR
MRPDAAGVITVFLVDDHEVVRQGVRMLLEAEDDLVVVGEAGTCEEALTRVPAVRPDVALLDVRLPDGTGVELCRDLRSERPELRCLMFTSFADDDALLNAMIAGAAGYVLKDVRGLALVAAIRTVAAGGSLLDAHATSLVLARLRAPAEVDPLDELSDREREILELIGEGLSNRQIAERLGLAEKTVKNYVSHLLGKLGMSRRAQVAVLATERRHAVL